MTIDRSAMTLKIGEVTLDFDGASVQFDGAPTRHRLPLMKTMGLIETYRQFFADRPVRGMLELGIFKGGSCVFFDHLLSPEVHVALDRTPEPWPALDEIAEDCAAQGRSLKLCYGIDQSDTVALTNLVSHNFQGRRGAPPLDLVVDDASHLYEPTCQSFNALFPYLRTNGVYAIEDWNCAQWFSRESHSPDPLFRSGIPLTSLLSQLFMICGAGDDIVRAIHIFPDVAFIVRGKAPLVSPGEVLQCC